MWKGVLGERASWRRFAIFHYWNSDPQFHNVHICGTALYYYSDEIVQRWSPPTFLETVFIFTLEGILSWNGGILFGHCRLWKRWRKLSKKKKRLKLGKRSSTQVSRYLYNLSASSFFFFYSLRTTSHFRLWKLEKLAQKVFGSVETGERSSGPRYLVPFSMKYSPFSLIHWTKPGFCALFRVDPNSVPILSSANGAFQQKG